MKIIEKSLYQISLLSVLFTIFSCSSSDPTLLMPSVTGEAGEVVIVIENALWESKVGETFKNFMLADVPAIPQSEPMFTVVPLPKRAFTNIIKTHRNVIFTKIVKDSEKAKMTTRENVWAKPQIYITIEAPDRESFANFLEQNKSKITERLLEAERKRVITNSRKYEALEVGNNLRDHHKITMNLPSGFKIYKDSATVNLAEYKPTGEKDHLVDTLGSSLVNNPELLAGKANVIWNQYETPMIFEGMVVYYHNYTDTAMFQKENLLDIRDILLKEHIPGPSPGSHMATDRMFPVSYREFEHKGRYTVEMRGLWRVENDFMGGPFVSFTTVDEERNRIVTALGFVYAPKYDKRNYIRRVEAMLYTLDFMKEELQ